jgi:hypothetical protein
MGQARNRGTFEVRNAQAIASGRVKAKKSHRGLFGMGDILGLMVRMLAIENTNKKNKNK